VHPNDEQQAHLAKRLFNAGKPQSAIDTLLPLQKKYPDNTFVMHYLGLCYFDVGQRKNGLSLLEKMVQLVPDKAVYAHNLGARYRLNGDFKKAQNYLEKAVALSPDSEICWGTLTNVYHDLKLTDKAKEAGLTCLTLKDSNAIKNFKKNYQNKFHLTNKNIPRGYQNNDKNIIAFSLWGDDPIYTRGAIINAIIAPYIYPEWITRFYVDASVPKDTINALKKFAGQVAFFEKSSNDYSRLFWRFLTADDKSVTRFICRDCDSRLNSREKLAVDAWVESGKPFHIMRDAYEHAELILAGMWGGVTGILPKMQTMIASYQHEHHEKWIDQFFLKTLIWPMIKDETLIHDTYYQFYHAREFPPVPRSAIDPGFRIGGREEWDLKRLFE